jgi:hypothetical protein
MATSPLAATGRSGRALVRVQVGQTRLVLHLDVNGDVRERLAFEETADAALQAQNVLA